MQHWILRCKHCNREYVYCTYGNGPEYGTEEGCSQEYCAECQKAINDSLSKIPVKYREHLEEIDFTPELIEAFKKLKNKRENDETGVFPSVTCYVPDPTDYDVIEQYQYKNRRYEVKYYEGTPEDRHLFAIMEYDIINDKPTGKPWRYKGSDNYSIRKNIHVMLSKIMNNCISEHYLEPPSNINLYMDFDFNNN